MAHFHSIPRTEFFSKMLLPALGVLVFGVALMGVFADPHTFQPRPVSSVAGGTFAVPSDFDSPASGGLRHWRTTAFFLTHVPEVCWGDNAVNDFQRRQCQEFWLHLGYGSLLGLMPFALVWLAWKRSIYSLRWLYSQARVRIEAGRAIGKGVVTSPAAAPDDVFSRFYCLRPIGVQLENQKQIKVYISPESPEPRPGQKMAVFEPVVSFGQPRHVAVIYTPHVAVVSGVRRA